MRNKITVEIRRLRAQNHLVMSVTAMLCPQSIYNSSSPCNALYQTLSGSADRVSVQPGAAANPEEERSRHG